MAALADAGLPDGSTTVGTRVELEHLLASPVGETVRVAARLDHLDGRLLRFEVVATDDGDRLLGRATVTRVLVDRERFMARTAR